MIQQSARSRKRGDPTKQRGLTLIELMIVLAILGIIISIALPNFVSSKIAANEASAIASVRNITTANFAYSQTVGKGSFTGNLADLAATSPALIDSVLASGQKSGYNFSLTSDGQTFEITAVPVQSGVTGVRTFTTDQTGALHSSSP